MPADLDQVEPAPFPPVDPHRGWPPPRVCGPRPAAL